MTAAVVANLRDLGGTSTIRSGRVRDGVVLRSAAPAHLPPDRADQLVAALGPVDYVDLRTDREVERDGGAEGLVERGWSWHRVPVHDAEPGLRETVSDRNLRTLPQYSVAARAVVDLIRGCRPVLLACSVGKDRTGAVVALLLHRFGVAAHVAAAEYEAGNAVLGAERALLPPRWRDNSSPLRAVRATEIDAVLRADRMSPADRAALDRARPFLLTPEAPPGAARKTLPPTKGSRHDNLSSKPGPGHRQTRSEA
ncbi:tyrosine-protein phosphatase [Amycolatopsis sp. GM8]|uniref:tyrosine-protein phosphatase n=1 Tax=Amycolatopsis sp. GM8 TaxID=2896530 RepID=UPI001F3C8AFF|nr:tyrosine-protein phosphatase [Amycolatopsis sp. GM8]